MNNEIKKWYEIMKSVYPKCRGGMDEPLEIPKELIGFDNYKSTNIMDEKECEFYIEDKTNKYCSGCKIDGGFCNATKDCDHKKLRIATEQLSIAREALSKLADFNNMKLENIYPTVSQALAKIEEVKC